jgi:hypothetical protein
LAEVEGRSHCSGVKAANARRMLDFMSEGGSLETLMQFCSTDSGMIIACGAPLMGSAEKKHLQRGAAAWVGLSVSEGCWRRARAPGAASLARVTCFI